MSDWLTANEFAKLAGICPRKARQALSRVKEGFTWRGHIFKVSRGKGRGGDCGYQYQVRLDTLPEELQQRWNASHRSLKRPSNPVQTTGLSRKWDWFRLVFAEVIAHPPNSRERGAAKAKLEGTTVTDWTGKPKVLKRSTFDKWIRKYDANGVRGLARQKRADKGKSRIIVSREWDKLVRAHLDQDRMERIARELGDYMAGLRQKNTQPRYALPIIAKRLETLTVKFGYRPNDPAKLRAACKISKTTYNRFLSHNKVHMFLRDRKKSDDSMPFVLRSIEGLRPMQLVVADWHPLDVFVWRPDGTTATPRMIAFMDVATGRLWREFVLFEAGKAPRNTHGLKALANMAQHPAFGMPENLYFDNGKEFGFGDYLGDAMKLVSGVLTDDSNHRLIRAIAYNAKAKPLEPVFGKLEGGIYQHLQGYVGGDRMKQMREQHGKQPAPFGTLEQLVAIESSLYDVYETTPQNGLLQGRSPRDVFALHVEDGWRATVADQDMVFEACSERDTRDLTNFAFKYDNDFWSCDELRGHLEDKVIIYKPKFGIHFERVRVESTRGELIGYATTQIRLPGPDWCKGSDQDTGDCQKSHTRISQERSGSRSCWRHDRSRGFTAAGGSQRTEWRNFHR